MIVNLRPLDQIEEAHLLDLIENQVPEGRDLEFKRDPIGRDDAAKKEFLKDISALANTVGGDLLIGIEEEDGIAAALRGIASAPSDAEIRRLESILQDGIEPRLLGTRMRAVSLSTGGYVLIIRVQRSWNSPHRVVYQRTNRFYARSSAGAYELGVEQLRAAFTSGAEVERWLNDFRFERLARLKGGSGAQLMEPGQLVLHIVPLQVGRATLDMRAVADPNAGFGPLTAGGWNHTPNFDGLLTEDGRVDENGRHGFLTQIFRDGRIEAGRGGLLFSRAESGYPRVLSYADSIPTMIEAVRRYITGLTRLGVAAPFAVMVSLLDVGGSVMLDSNHFAVRRPLDRDELLFEPIMLEDTDFADGCQRVLRSLFDTWWNAYGWQRCFHLYDDDGSWKGYPRNWRLV